MRAVYMLIHQRKPNTQELASSVVDAFESCGIAVSAEEWLVEKMGDRSGEMFADLNPFECDAVIAVGGDGTLLRANALAMQYQLPVLGINVGRLGFLTEVELDDLQQACLHIARDEYTVEERMMLEANIDGQTLLALNDIVVSRGGYARLIGLDAKVNDEMVGHFVADGLIVATPTGSTGYSLSAGGPLICPEVECMLITPICAHSLQHRPVVTSADLPITIQLTEERNAMISADGQEPVVFTGGHELVITKSHLRARFIRLHHRSFFSRVRVKLTEWSC